jgi:acyl-CoA thioester hydrolase
MFETPIIPRVSETDGAGHINNVFVPVWFESGRREIFEILTPTLEFSDWKVALVNMNVDYLAQIYFQHDAVVHTWIDRIGTKSFTVYEEIWQRDELCARGTATYVYMNYVENRSEVIPADARSEFEKHLRET